MVLGAAACQHRVEHLPGFLAGDDAVHDVGGQALGGVDCGGVPELDVGGDVLGRQHGDESGVAVSHSQRAVVDARDGPAVAVLDPVGAAHAESAVVVSGEYDVADRRVRAVPQADLVAIGRVPEPGGPRSTVQLPHEVVGGRQHQAVPARRLLALPCVEDLVDDGGLAAGVDALVVEVVAEGLAVAIP
jgi:hypothetical protein